MNQVMNDQFNEMSAAYESCKKALNNYMKQVRELEEELKLQVETNELLFKQRNDLSIENNELKRKLADEQRLADNRLKQKWDELDELREEIKELKISLEEIRNNTSDEWTMQRANQILNKKDISHDMFCGSPDEPCSCKEKIKSVTCNACNYKFESSANKDSDIKCPQCGSNKLLSVMYDDTHVEIVR